MSVDTSPPPEADYALGRAEGDIIQRYVAGDKILWRRMPYGPISWIAEWYMKSHQVTFVDRGKLLSWSEELNYLTADAIPALRRAGLPARLRNRRKLIY